METIYLRRWEELNRTLNRLRDFYNGEKDKQDSLQGPKDFVLNFFRVCYELKETLKKDANLVGFDGQYGLVESFINNNPDVALGIDIANQNKHLILNNRRRSTNNIGTINGHIYLSLPSGKSRVEITINIDDIAQDCLKIAESNLNSWKRFLSYHNLIS